MTPDNPMPVNDTTAPGRTRMGVLVTLILLGLTLAVLVASAPSSLQEAYRRGGFYVFSEAFLEDLPKRLTGPGWFRLLLQPVVAVLLGVRDGRADARAGRRPDLVGLLFGRGGQRDLVAGTITRLANLLLMGILLDSVFQWAILGSSYPGAALVVGPVLIVTPYVAARGFANRLDRVRARR